MPLDLAQVVSQIKGLVARLKAGQKDKEEHLELALETLRSNAADIQPLKSKISASKTTWLVAGLIDELDQQHEAPPCPQNFTVLATDGSHIDVDRHSSVPCCLINTGSAVLHYGESPDASLFSEATIVAGDELAIVDPVGSKREELIEGPLLGLKRSVEECVALTKVATELPPERPALALLDGSLILWGLTGRRFPEFVREALLEKGYLAALDNLKRLSLDRNLALASYISFPRSADVVNALRVALCPHDPADCDFHCSGKRPPAGRECDQVSGIQDRDLFRPLLSYGERSPLFVSGSPFMQKYYREHQIHFFYLKLEDEMARVEVPLWVAEREELVGLVHALVLDQCRRGHGYPVALMEAHEKAVVTTADREQFWQLVEIALAEDRLTLRSSGKKKSKRLRWV